jgi:Tfp pilus assembly protein PilX
MKRPTHTRGFTLLLAALVSSLVLILGVSIFELVQRQVSLSGLGRDSQFAFYAADTAAECALYWDIRFGYFSSSTPSVTPSCDAVNWSDVSGSVGSLPYTIAFRIENLFGANGNCADVSVTKSATSPRTRIHADGYSAPCSQINDSGRVLQRSVELRY